MRLQVLLLRMETTFVDDWVTYEVTREGVLTVRREAGDDLVFEADDWIDVKLVEGDR